MLKLDSLSLQHIVIPSVLEAYNDDDENDGDDDDYIDDGGGGGGS